MQRFAMYINFAKIYESLNYAWEEVFSRRFKHFKKPRKLFYIIVQMISSLTRHLTILNPESEYEVSINFVDLSMFLFSHNP